MGLSIREYQPRDAAALRQCVVVLQDSERTFYPRVLEGEAMADAYCERLHRRCREADGRIFVAEVDGVVVGFVSVLGRETFKEPDEPVGTYAYVADLVVLAGQRGQGIGRQLLTRAEEFAREAGAPELRIGVRPQNVRARQLYFDTGFAPHLEILIKRWPV